jgi:pimeloyl-ACP methyl ester carboxylesterase
LNQGSFTKEKSDFKSRGARCSGWLYRPEGKSRPAIVVMAHGFGAEAAFALPAFAERFASQGLAVYLFDYRTFGASEGEPRYLINPWRQIEDWKAALAHVRSLPDINADKLAVFGSSYSGGHVIRLAAQDPNIKAMVAQVPFVDGITSTIRTGIIHAAQGLLAGSRDLVRMLTLRKPYYVPIAGSPETFAVLNAPECEEGYFALIPEGSDWKNETPARAMIQLFLYRPTAKASKVMCPALIIPGRRDSLISPKAVEKAASRMREASLVKIDAGHFDVYSGALFEKVVGIEADFLVSRLQ